MEKMSKRWKPKKYEWYWMIAFSELVPVMWNADGADLSRWQIGNCFKTKEEATDALEKFTALLLNSHAPSTDCKQLPDWCRHNALCYDGKEYLRVLMDGSNSIYAYPVGGGTVKAYEISEITEARLRLYNADEMYDYIIDGNPCVTFEHLEDGEWVE